jgi:hypothetical protein
MLMRIGTVVIGFSKLSKDRGLAEWRLSRISIAELHGLWTLVRARRQRQGIVANGQLRTFVNPDG